MAERHFLLPSEVASEFVTISESKSNLSLAGKFILGIMAGVYISFAAVASNAATFQLLNLPGMLGISKLISACVFTGGLIIVVSCGSELFTGNSLMIIGVLDNKISIFKMLSSWGIVYIANFLGAVLIASLVFLSGQWDFDKGELGAVTIKIALAKVSLPPLKVVVLGILCNWLVCLAVWGSTAARSIGDKILAIFFPIMMFVVSGFEHCVANMYYIPAGIFAKANPLYVDAAIGLGVSENALDKLNFSTFLTNNLLPATLGNVIGGVIFVGTAYWAVYLLKKR
ncbi:MAG: formate/nitrite transporter family protein [Eubacterium sp.]|nr:formate/nitrite transporter family protein [Eubacterium sp.]